MRPSIPVRSLVRYLVLSLVVLLCGLIIFVWGQRANPPAAQDQGDDLIKALGAAGDRVPARQALSMPDLWELCVIPEYESVQLFFKGSGFRSETGMQIEKRFQSAPTIEPTTTGLLAFGQEKQRYLVIQMTEEGPANIYASPQDMGCFEGASAEFVKRPSGWWSLQGKKFQYRIQKANTVTEAP